MSIDSQAPTSAKAPTAMSIEVRDLGIDIGPSTILNDVSLSIAAGEILVLTGPSGCGKSTLLRAIAGLTMPQRGHILADEQLVTSTSRDRAMVFQEDVLLPWRTVSRNIDLALRLRGVGKAQRPAQIDSWLEEVGLAEFKDYLPRSLSGGMRQRVQLARGLAGAPRAVLMDEPFGALDAQTRHSMQGLLIRTLDAHPTTVIFVTHDVEEALTLGHRVIVLSKNGAIRESVTVSSLGVAGESERRDSTDDARTRILHALGN